MDQIEAEDPAVQVALLGLTVILDPMDGVLTKIVYLSSLRDNKAGTYVHPSLSRVHGAERTDRALAICHRDLFRWLVKAHVSQYVKELEVYMRAANNDVVAEWRALQSYRGTIPSGASRFLSEIYSHNMESALLILQNRSSGGEGLAS